MSVPVAEITSLHDTLEQLARRLGAIAREQEGPARESPIAAELLAIEGQLSTAGRRLEKLLRRL